jgi:chromosome segregation ATPase
MRQLEDQIKDLKSRLEKAKDIKYRAELKLENLKRQEENLLQELNELGVEPDQLAEEIKRLEEEINREIAEANACLPEELRR